MSAVLGLDIGGANLKAAHSNGVAKSLPFPLWKNPHQLTDKLQELATAFPPFDRIAVTMTGELCDCYATKHEGVAAILDAVETAFPGQQLLVWRTAGAFTDPATARQTPLLTGAANWLALATFVCRYVGDAPALLIDIGSTTTDLIPLLGGKPVPSGWTDQERLQTRELVYTGMTRTPVCALLGSEGMAEFFATMLDVNLLLEQLPEAPEDCDTADGRPATRACAHARLARMVGADAETMSLEKAIHLATHVSRMQRNLIHQARRHVLARMPGPPAYFILTGAGAAHATVMMHGPPTGEIPQTLFLRDKLGDDISRAACAYAVAVLARERHHA